MSTSPAFDDDISRDDGAVSALWVDGLLRSLAEPADAQSARVERFLTRLREDDVRLATRHTTTKRMWIGMTVAASLLIGFFVFNGGLRIAQASVETLVREAQQALQLTADRCYVVHWKPQPGETLQSRLPNETRLWTRGDRFWFVATGARHVACGLDPLGRIWVARTPQVGILYDADEADVPAELTLSATIYSMRLDVLLDDVLRDFDLHRESPLDAAVQTIRAELKPGRTHPSVKSALLEIDPITHAVTRLELWRRQVIVTYDLVETGRQDDAQYALEGHLDVGARIYTRTQFPEMRNRHARDE